jgi:hypothetical protein
VVTACVDEAKQRRREALAPVRLRELRFDADERQRRASERLVQTQRKQEEAAHRPADGASTARPTRPAASAPASPASRAGKATASRPVTSPPDTSAKKEAYARREQAIQTHREEVEQRNAERAQQHPRAAPLPVPASGAAASSAGH